MKITEIPEELIKVYPVEIVDGAIIKINGKDGSTLTIKPVLENENIVDYEMDYLTKKEVKAIDKLNKKQEEILKEIEEIKLNGMQKDKNKDEDEEVIEYIAEEIITEEVQE